MKIIELTAENVKRLKVVEITPTGGLNQITGENESGKSSVLDAIWYLLGGKGAICSVPIRTGEESARIRGVLGDRTPELIVERKFNATGTTSLTVRNLTDAPPGTPDRKLQPLGSPQEILDALVGSLSFDPLEFSRMDDRGRYKLLMSTVDLGVDLEAMEAANAADEARRRDINRDAKAARARAEGITVSADAANGPLDEAALIDQMQAAAKHNSDIETANASRERARSAAESGYAESARYLALAEEARKNADTAYASAQNIMAQLAKAEPLPEPMDVTAIRTSLDTAKRINQAVDQKRHRDELAKEAAELEAKSESLTKAIAAREKQKTDALKAAEMPVDGLEPRAGAVYLNGLPFDQASDSVRLRTGVAIAMAANPKLRVLRIKDGSLLDAKHIAMLAELAKDRDYQFWMERVDSSGSVGIVMEDGQVASVNGVKTEPSSPPEPESSAKKRGKKSGGFTADAHEIANMFSDSLKEVSGE